MFQVHHNERDMNLEGDRSTHIRKVEEKQIINSHIPTKNKKLIPGGINAKNYRKNLTLFSNM
jgi:hypothetical protein